MKKMIKIFATLSFILSLCVVARAGEPTLLKVAGNFKVKSIDKIDSGFKVIFSPEDGSKNLLLKTSHIHAGVVVGSSLRLSAEVIGQGSLLEVNQVVLFLPIPEGVKPIWMLSEKYREGSAPSKYIEMHDPQSDYVLF